MNKEIGKAIEEKQKQPCEHSFRFSHWENYLETGLIIYTQRAVVVCPKCGEIRIKKIKDYEK